MTRISPKLFKLFQNQSKNVQIYPKSAGFAFKILLTAESAGYTFKILLLVSKPTGHEVPRCRNNLQLWFLVSSYVMSCILSPLPPLPLCTALTVVHLSDKRVIKEIG